MSESVLARRVFVPGSRIGVRKSHRRILRRTFGHSAPSPGPTRTPDSGFSLTNRDLCEVACVSCCGPYGSRISNIREEPNVSRNTFTVFCTLYMHIIKQSRNFVPAAAHARTHTIQRTESDFVTARPQPTKITGRTPGVGVRVGPSLAAGSGPGSVVAWSIHSLHRPLGCRDGRVEVKKRFRRTPGASQHTGRHQRSRGARRTS